MSLDEKSLQVRRELRELLSQRSQEMKLCRKEAC